MNEPIHILSLGAGVQSSTLALMAAAGEIGPMPLGGRVRRYPGGADERVPVGWIGWSPGCHFRCGALPGEISKRISYQC